MNGPVSQETGPFLLYFRKSNSMEALKEVSVMDQNTLPNEEFYARVSGPFCQRNPDLRF